jgi:ribosome-binding protein aMBF1 (putative translation factor)
VKETSLERIIERIQSSIVEAREMQLKMLERILSIALLEAYENRSQPDDKPYSDKPHKPHNNGY